MKIAIIGAGMAGLTVAKKLKDFADITIFEKSRGAGGRICSRYTEPFVFDHGAQFFTTKDSEFNELVQKGKKNKEIAIFDHPQKGLVYVGNPVFKTFISTLVSPFNIFQNTLVT